MPYIKFKILSLKNVVVSNIKRTFIMPFPLPMEISFFQQYYVANHSKILCYLLVITLLIWTQDFLGTYIHFCLLFFSVDRLQRLTICRPWQVYLLLLRVIFPTLRFTLLMYIILDVVSMYHYDLLFFRCRALCNEFNNATNVYYAITSCKMCIK
jgi:hypothetical protein